ncbi:MAG TPA: lycopene cyclase domain-containing protein [Longimicrobium sp.]|nr:lycopene cyclase domain-containing protein [Longimicrobium sp.]
MTYLAFHALFILPPVLALAAWVWRRRALLPRRAGWALPAIAAIAFAYTTPWDNYLVARGVWRYGADRVLGVIGYVPVEEYLFFILQPILAGLWFYAVLIRRLETSAADSAASTTGRRLRGFVPAEGVAVRDTFLAAGVRIMGAAAWLIVAALGATALIIGHQWTYAGLILAWAAPVLAAMWIYAGGEIWLRRRACLAALAAPTLYLWVADAIAIRLGIWSIDARYSTGIIIAGLPVEEALFFLITNLLVVTGLVALLHPPSDALRIARTAPTS